MGHLLVTIKRYYVAAALILLNGLLAFAVINLLAVVGFVALDMLWPRTNVVFEKYGGALPEVYPGLSQSEINALLNETWGRTSLFQP